MELYVWGSNKFKQITAKKELHVYSPISSMDFDGQTPASISSGDNHSLVLTDYGDVYSFGRGSEGQLGHPVRNITSTPKIVAALAHETVVDIACGSVTSYAVTASGQLYQWGLVHASNKAVAGGGSAPDMDDIDDVTAASSGQLTGLAQDDNTMVAVDEEARLVGDHSMRPGASRQLRDIVRDSTERWLLANDGADAEYYRELQSMGYHNEEVDLMMAQRGKEYHGMLRLGCKRILQNIPSIVRGLDDVRVVSVSAGYAHCMIISDTGFVYAAGYNDRGQLGLGHRISTSSFKRLDYMAGKFVLQVCCGQQHTLCRAVERSRQASHGQGQGQESDSASSGGGGLDVDVYVGSKVGADVYSWGNGMLGQLGLGLRGTSKGRLLPTLNTTLHELHPRAITDIATGHNFSVAVSSTGRVYSFGHAEYNQHGTGGHAASDYTDAFYYFEPRQVNVMNTSTALVSGINRSSSSVPQSYPACITQVSCGANFTIGVDVLGNVYSWGWNESGVLGHGIGHFSSAPCRITGLGPESHGRQVHSVSAGAKHVLALVGCATGTPAAAQNHLRFLYQNMNKYFDAVIVFDPASAIGSGGGSGGGAGGGGGRTNEGEAESAAVSSYACHRLVLACRSAYLRGFIAATEAEVTGSGAGAAGSPSCIFSSDRPVQLDLTGYPFANAVTVRALLEYLYLDKVNIITHKKKQLLELAELLCLDRLRLLLTPTTSLNLKVSKAAAANGGDNDNSSLLSSTFTTEMRTAINDARFADVVFVLSADERRRHAVVDGIPSPLLTRGGGGGGGGGGSGGGGAVSGADAEAEDLFVFGHKCILSQFDYFDALFNSNFSEATTRRDDNCVRIDLDGLIADGIDLDTFLATLQFAYTGQWDRTKPDAPAVTSAFPKDSAIGTGTGTGTGAGTGTRDVSSDSDIGTEIVVGADIHLPLSMLVSAGRLGHPRLAMAAERDVVSKLRENFPHNATSCLQLAQVFGFSRLERKCLEALRLGKHS